MPEIPTRRNSRENRGKVHAAVVPWSHLNPPACMYVLVGSKENVWFGASRDSPGLFAGRERLDRFRLNRE